MVGTIVILGLLPKGLADSLVLSLAEEVGLEPTNRKAVASKATVFTIPPLSYYIYLRLHSKYHQGIEPCLPPCRATINTYDS